MSGRCLPLLQKGHYGAHNIVRRSEWGGQVGLETDFESTFSLTMTVAENGGSKGKESQEAGL